MNASYQATASSKRLDSLEKRRPPPQQNDDYTKCTQTELEDEMFKLNCIRETRNSLPQVNKDKPLQRAFSFTGYDIMTDGWYCFYSKHNHVYRCRSSITLRHNL